MNSTTIYGLSSDQRESVESLVTATEIHHNRITLETESMEELDLDDESYAWFEERDGEVCPF